MSKYNVGDKFIIEIEEEVRDNLYRIRGFNSLVFDDNGLKKLKRIQEKTRLEDFTEKHPNHRKGKDGYPTSCSIGLGYTDDCIKGCRECWDMPL